MIVAGKFTVDRQITFHETDDGVVVDKITSANKSNGSDSPKTTQKKKKRDTTNYVIAPKQVRPNA